MLHLIQSSFSYLVYLISRIHAPATIFIRK